MAEIAVGKCIGAVLEPDNDRVELTERPNAWMMNIVVDDKVGDGKAERSVHGMGDCGETPD